MKILIVYNPISGSGIGKKVALELYEYLESKFLSATLIESKSKEDLQNSLAREIENYELVLICGGDGTFRDAIETAVCEGATTPIGLIPAGSGNDFGRAFGIKNTPKDLLDIYLKSDDTYVYGIHYNDNYLINVFGVGLDTAILKKRQDFKYLKGSFSYLVSAIINLFTYKASRYRVKLDDETIEGRFNIVSVCNGQYIGGGMKIGPNADMYSEYFEIITMEKSSIYKLVKGFARIYKGGHIELPYVNSYRSKTVQIEFLDHGEYMNIDGDVVYEEKKVVLKKDETPVIKLKKPYLSKKRS